MRTEGKRFGIHTSKTLRMNALTTQEYRLSHLDEVSETIVEGIKERHENQVNEHLPPSQCEEEKYQKKSKKMNKKR